MTNDPSQRIQKWDAKFNTERVKGALDASRARMLVNVQAVFPQLTAMELQVKQVLDGLGISTALYGLYMSFAREIWSKQRRGISGESLAQACATLVAKWVAMGLTQTVLERIRSDVFTVPPPAGP